MLFQDQRDPAPVVKKAQIAETDAMYHDKRVSGGAAVIFYSKCFHIPAADSNQIFVFGSPAHDMGKIQLDKRHPHKQQNEQTLGYPQIAGSKKDAQTSVDHKQPYKNDSVNHFYGDPKGIHLEVGQNVIGILIRQEI